MLTTEQQLHFDTFGFIVQRGLFSPDEMAEITREFDDVTTEARGGKSFAGEEQGLVRVVRGQPFGRFFGGNWVNLFLTVFREATQLPYCNLPKVFSNSPTAS
jgi:hypothetical protein